MLAGARSLVALVGAMLLLAGLAAWWWLGRAEPPIVPASAPSELLARPATPQSANALAVPDDAAASLQREVQEQPRGPLATVRGRCVGPDGAVIVGCTVRVHGYERDSEAVEQWLDEHAVAVPWQEPASVVTDAEGGFAMSFWPPPPYRFRVEFAAPGHVAAMVDRSHLPAGSTTELGDVVLAPGVRVTGRVVDVGGRPLLGAKVVVGGKAAVPAAKGVLLRNSAAATSAANGEFELLSALLPGAYELRVVDERLVSPPELLLSADRPVEWCDVVVGAVAAADTISGWVRDEHGRAVAGVQVHGTETGGSGTVDTDAGGRFELRRTGSSRRPTTRVHVASGGEASAPRELAWGSRDVELQFVHGDELTVAVRDLEAQPVANFLVRLLPIGGDVVSSANARVRARGPFVDGTATVAGLRPGNWLLDVEFGTASPLATLLVPFAHVGGSRRIELVAAPRRERTVRVVDGAGQPCEGAEVRLCELFDLPFDAAREVMAPRLWRGNGSLRHALILDAERTDAQGRVTLRGPAGRSFGLCLPGPGHVPTREVGFTLEGQGEWLVRVGRGATLVARLGPPEALVTLRQMAGLAPVASFPAELRPRLELVADDLRSHPADRSTARSFEPLAMVDDGTWRVAGVPAGTWRVALQAVVARGGSSMGRRFALGQVVLIDGRETTQEFEVAELVTGTLAGQVRRDGQPLSRGEVHLFTDGEAYHASTDADGRFELSVRPGEYTLAVVNHLPGGGYTNVHCATRVPVVRGQVSQALFEVATGSLRIELRTAAGTPAAGVPLYKVPLARPGRALPLPPTDAHGVVTFRSAVGPHELRLLPAKYTTAAARDELQRRASGNADPFAAHWLVLDRVELQAGVATTATLVLPEGSGY